MKDLRAQSEEAHEMLDPTVRANAAMNAIDRTKAGLDHHGPGAGA